MKSTEPGRTCLPIMSAILRQLQALWSKEATDFNCIMLWAACCTAFFGFFWMGEISAPASRKYDSNQHLSITEIAVDNGSSPTTPEEDKDISVQQSGCLSGED